MNPQQQQKWRNPLPASRLTSVPLWIVWQWQLVTVYSSFCSNWFRFLNSLRISIITKMVLVALCSAAGQTSPVPGQAVRTLTASLSTPGWCRCWDRGPVSPPFAVRAFSWGELIYLRLIKLLRKGIRLISHCDAAAANIKRFHFFVK